MDNQLVEKPKRGRKPKNVIKDSQKTTNEEKIPIKRGRKPKDKYGVIKNEINIKELGSVILHLQINSKDINSNFVDKELLSYSPEIKSPEPYDITMSILPYNSHISSSSPYPFSNNENNDSNDIQNIEVEKTNLENKIEQNIEEIDKNINSYDMLSCNITKVYNCNTIEHNNQYCYWCCHTFKNKQIGLPINYKNNKYEYFGTFCSPECACAYNYNSNVSQEDIFNRYTLLNMMCCELYDDDIITIKKASSKLILQMFGGPLSIDEFRKNNTNYSKDYKILNPPLVSIVPQIVEIQVNKINKFIPIDNNRINGAIEDLKLQRKLPAKSKNTLELCMNLTCN